MLRINKLSVSYGDRQVLKEVNLECEAGVIHGLLGMNGAGKTTLFRTIYGFKKKDSGACHIGDGIASNRSIAMLETNPFFYSYMKGKEYLELLSLENKGFDFNKWNELFELPLDDLIDTYSTGMKKKLAFLGLISLDRPVLILDEPFSGVDIESNEKIFQILERIKQSGKVILLSSHILESFKEVCDKISWLKSGRIVRTYAKAEFSELGKQLKAEINKKIGGVLDELF